MGIDFDSVLSFYIDGEIDTYHGKNKKYLNILLGGEMSQPYKMVLIYSNYPYTQVGEVYCAMEHVDKDCNKLYKDLIKYFKYE